MATSLISASSKPFPRLDTVMDTLVASDIPSHLTQYASNWDYESPESSRLQELNEKFGIDLDPDLFNEFINTSQASTSQNFGKDFIPDKLKPKVEEALTAFKEANPPRYDDGESGRIQVSAGKGERDFYRELFNARNKMVEELNSEYQRRQTSYEKWKQENEKYLGRFGTILPGKVDEQHGSGIEGKDMERAQLKRAGTLLGTAKGPAAKDVKSLITSKPLGRA